MIIAALLLFAAPTDEADAANMAFTTCLFATSRSAHAAHLSVGAFEQKLASTCWSEQHVLERAMATIFRRRGEPNPAASAHSLAEDSRRALVQDYRRVIELEPELRKLAELCRAHPDQCRQ